MSVPNQKKIYIERESDTAKKDFLKVSNTNLFEAMYNLKPSAFELWIYFVDNANGYALDLYPIDFISKAKTSRSTYDRAFQELEEKGYLIHSSKQKNLYIFKERSDKAEYIDMINSIDSESFKEIKEKYFEEDI